MPSSIFNKKIAYISDQQYPIEKADSEQVANTVSALQNAGLQIDLIIPRDWRNFGLSAAKRSTALQEFYHLNAGLRTRELVHLPLSPLRIEKYSHGLVAPFWAKLKKYDFVYTRNPLPAFLSNKLGLKIIYETYRVHKKSTWVKSLVGFKNLYGIITHSKPSRESLLACGAEPEQVAVIHNGINPALFESGLNREQARQKLGLLGSAKIACYSGRLDKEKGVDYLLKLALKVPEVDFLLLGKTQKDPEDWIHKLAGENGLENIKTPGWVPPNELAIYLKASDVLMIPPTAAPLNKFGKTVLPMKLFGYLAAAKPVLAPNLPDSESVLNVENAILVEPDNLDVSANALRRIFKEPDWANKKARQAGEDSKALTWDGRARSIISFLQEMLRRKF